MSIWVLIILACTNSYTGGVAVHSVQFNTEYSCIAAASKIEANSAYPIKIKTTCVENIIL